VPLPLLLVKVGRRIVCKQQQIDIGIRPRAVTRPRAHERYRAKVRLVDCPALDQLEQSRDLRSAARRDWRLVARSHDPTIERTPLDDRLRGGAGLSSRHETLDGVRLSLVPDAYDAVAHLPVSDRLNARVAIRRARDHSSDLAVDGDRQGRADLAHSGVSKPAESLDEDAERDALD
jgi:hypothetical protein